MFESFQSRWIRYEKLPQDTVVTTIYSLTNLLFVTNEGLLLPSKSTKRFNTGLSGGDNLLGREAFASPMSSRRTSFTSFSQAFSKGANSSEFDENDYRKVCENAVTGIIEVCENVMMKVFQH